MADPDESNWCEKRGTFQYHSDLRSEVSRVMQGSNMQVSTRFSQAPSFRYADRGVKPHPT